MEAMTWEEVTTVAGVVGVVTATRARERVHRLPLTVVIDSGGDAIRALSHRKTRRKGRKERD